METGKFNLERAQEEAEKIKKIAAELKAARGNGQEEPTNPTKQDYGDAEKIAEVNLPDLSDLLQEPTQDYSAIIQEAGEVRYSDKGGFGEGPWWRTRHSEMLKDLVREGRLDPEILKLFRDAISGNILCDLGSAGGGLVGYIAKVLSAGLYIEVDKFPNGQDDPTPIDSTRGRGEIYVSRGGRFFNEGPIKEVQPEIHVRADMLDFISRLKSSSVNIVINGIDTDIIAPNKYHEFLAKEMLRVVRDNGLIFGDSSTSLGILRQMIEKDLELKNRFEIIDYQKHKIGAGGVVVIHKKVA